MRITVLLVWALFAVTSVAAAQAVTPSARPAPPREPSAPAAVPEAPRAAEKEKKPAQKKKPAAASSGVRWSCDFERDYCGMAEQSKIEPARRSSFVPTPRQGAHAVMLTTMPGDDEVHSSGKWERNDLQLSPSSSYCNEGQEEWWALSVLFPDEYAPTPLGTVMDFHHNASGGQANFHLVAKRNTLLFHGFAGNVNAPQEYKREIGPVMRNVWYDFVYHVKWSSGNDGRMTAWLNGNKVLVHEGPTLYKGISCYLKLANYHEPNGFSSSVVFDRIIRGDSAASVSDRPLED